LKPILYIETNFAVGIASRQNVAWSKILDEPDSIADLVIPAVCFMEVLSNLESVEKKRWGSLRANLTERTKQLRRNLMSMNAALLVRNFEQSLMLAENLQEEMQARFEDVLERICKRVDIIGFETDAMIESIQKNYIDSPTDNLILCTILGHARRNSGRTKAFLSANTDDFKKIEVEDVMNAVGVRYFSRLENALGWLKSEQDKDLSQADPDQYPEP